MPLHLKCDTMRLLETSVESIYMCYKDLDKWFAVVHGKRLLNEATGLNSLTPLSKSEICKILPDVSPTTVEAVLGAMVKDSTIQRIGAGRASKYLKA